MEFMKFMEPTQLMKRLIFMELIYLMKLMEPMKMIGYMFSSLPSPFFVSYGCVARLPRSWRFFSASHVVDFSLAFLALVGALVPLHDLSNSFGGRDRFYNLAKHSVLWHAAGLVFQNV